MPSIIKLHPLITTHLHHINQHIIYQTHSQFVPFSIAKQTEKEIEEKREEWDKRERERERRRREGRGCHLQRRAKLRRTRLGDRVRSLIRLQRINNFLLFHAVLLSILDVL